MNFIDFVDRFHYIDFTKYIFVLVDSMGLILSGCIKLRPNVVLFFDIFSIFPSLIQSLQSPALDEHLQQQQNYGRHVHVVTLLFCCLLFVHSSFIFIFTVNSTVCDPFLFRKVFYIFG